MIVSAKLEAFSKNHRLRSQGLFPFGLPMPGEEFVQAGLRQVGNSVEDVGEPSLGIDVVELGGADQSVHHSGPRGRTPRQALGAASVGSGLDRQPGKSGFALPGDLGRSLRLLDDAQLDRLGEAAADDVRRRGRNAPNKPTRDAESLKRTPAKAARARPEKPNRPDTVSAGQERLILAAVEAGHRPAAIAKEFRVSRLSVQHVMTDAKRDRRKTEL